VQEAGRSLGATASRVRLGTAASPAPPDRGDRRCLKPEVAAFKEAPTRPWSPRTARPRAEATQAESRAASNICISYSKLVCRRRCSASPSSSPSPLPRRRVRSAGEHHDPHHRAVDPAFEPWPNLSVRARLVARCMLVCPLPARVTTQTRRRLRDGHRAEPVACRCRCRRRRVRSVALQCCRTFVPTSAGSLSAPPPLRRRRSARTRTYTQGLNPQFSRATCSHMCSPGSKVLPFLGRDSWPAHTPQWPGMPVPPACLRHSGSSLYAVVLDRELHR
jgi:hypothetical protein